MADEKENMVNAMENMSKEEQIGFHKGALSTLAKEREEMAKIVNICEQLMQLHLKSLKDLGVDLESQSKNFAQPEKTDKKIDDLL
jgi:hypothetical protein